MLQLHVHPAAGVPLAALVKLPQTTTTFIEIALQLQVSSSTSTGTRIQYGQYDITSTVMLYVTRIHE